MDHSQPFSCRAVDHSQPFSQPFLKALDSKQIWHTSQGSNMYLCGMQHSFEGLVPARSKGAGESSCRVNSCHSMLALVKDLVDTSTRLAGYTCTALFAAQATPTQTVLSKMILCYSYLNDINMTVQLSRCCKTDQAALHHKLGATLQARLYQCISSSS